MIRHAMQNLEALYAKLNTSHPHKRSVTVEIMVPKDLVKCHDPSFSRSVQCLIQRLRLTNSEQASLTSQSEVHQKWHRQGVGTQR